MIRAGVAVLLICPNVFEMKSLSGGPRFSQRCRKDIASHSFCSIPGYENHFCISRSTVSKSPPVSLPQDANRSR